MKKFIALYMAPASTIEALMKSMTPEASKAAMAEWIDWETRNKASLVDGGAPLGRTRRVTLSGVSDTRNDITGYTIVEAGSHEAAARLFEGHPHLRMEGATIDILAFVDLPEM